MATSKRAVERSQRGLPEPQKCHAHKKDGSPCGRWPVRGATVCPKHGGAAPQVRQRAKERLDAHADILMTSLLKIATSAESEAVRLAATRDALDRAGFGAAQMHKLSVQDPWADLLSDIITDEDVFEPATVKPRGLPPGRAGGVEADDDDEDYDWDATAVSDSDDDEPRRPVVIRGEVVHDPRFPTDPDALRRTEARARQRIVSNIEPGEDEIDRSEFGDVASTYAASDDPAMPPAYVREAMESEGLDWRTGDRLKVQWAG